MAVGRPAAQVDHIPSANSLIHKRERRINNNKNNNNNNNNNNDNSIQSLRSSCQALS
jgi:hypothetical protein